ncbi:hypothetical protein L873DRAFT_1791361 [Choiromyces venosus 120613-1]|uniref:C2H2-type domain-containing protein n=1 Tax=Choiromyces venosus 120613-1 TaxID=1336337 RepID=A0A3N4JSK5_9PEZI|nr:hypothetical protein L873DRAFT_1791361 [Choiromyces venosus 120613-1]
MRSPSSFSHQHNPSPHSADGSVLYTHTHAHISNRHKIHQDGWHSVLGPWNGTTITPKTANERDEASQESDTAILTAPETEDINGVDEINQANQANHTAIPIAARNRPKNARSTFKIICKYQKCSGNRGPHTCAPGRFTCEAPNCSWLGTFKTRQALNRHYLAKHLSDQVDCPVEGCPRVGARGIKREDNLAAHILNKHGIPSSRPPIGN